MGQNQSHEEPYHKRHYNETNQQIQRQNSLTLSSTNLLLARDNALKRAGGVHNNSTPALHQDQNGELVAKPASIATTATATTIQGDSRLDAGAGNPTPFIRLLPIEKETIYYEESEDEDKGDDERLEQERDGNVYEKRMQDRQLAPSPSFMDSAMNVNTRLGRRDSFEQHSRDRADFERAKDEEQEDLSYLSPTAGTYRFTLPVEQSAHALSEQPFDHDQLGLHHLDSNNQREQQEEPFLKRYQLYDPPVQVPTPIPTSKMVEDLRVRTNINDIQPSIQSAQLRSPLLDVIQEEDETTMHLKAASQAREDSEQSRTGRHDTLPLQETNINSAAKMDSCISPDGTLHSVEDLYDMATADLNERIQQAVQQVELKYEDRVQRLEDHTASLSISASTENMDMLDSASYHSRGSKTLRKEALSDVSQKVGDLDSRVNQMESLVSYKLVDIESKVKELSSEQNEITQVMHQPDISQDSKEQRNILTSRTSDVSGRRLQRRHMESEDDMENAKEGKGSNSIALVDRASIVELRGELQAFGMRYHELNDGLLTDLMGQMREAKLMMFDTVDEVDKTLGMRVDRIEAEMHAKLLIDIENRIQERVLAMEQMSGRLEKCFDRMDGRLGALETVLASKRVRPESMYRILQQQQQQEQDDQEDASGQVPAFMTAVQTTSKATTSTFKQPARSTKRSMTMDSTRSHSPFSPSSIPADDHRGSMTPQRSSSFGIGGTQPIHIPTSSKAAPETRNIRRPSSYKELLHFWKAGASTPDLLSTNKP